MTARSQAQRRRQELKRDERRRQTRAREKRQYAAWMMPRKYEQQRIEAALVRRRIALWHAAQAALRIEKKFGHTNRREAT